MANLLYQRMQHDSQEVGKIILALRQGLGPSNDDFPRKKVLAWPGLEKKGQNWMEQSAHILAGRPLYPTRA